MPSKLYFYYIETAHSNLYNLKIIKTCIIFIIIIYFVLLLGAAICEEIANAPALLLSGLLKDFLRSLPDPLLAGNAQEWLSIASTGRIEHLRRLITQLPRENHLVLAHVTCVLYNIAKRARFNLMSAANLGKLLKLVMTPNIKNCIYWSIQFICIMKEILVVES